MYEILRRSFLFQSLEEDALLRLRADGLQLAAYSAGQDIFPAERQGGWMGIIARGKAEVRKTGSNVIMSILGEGDEFGAASLYSGRDYFVTDIIALGDVQAVYISKQAIDELMGQYTDIARNYIAYLSQRIYFLNSRIDGFTSGSVHRSLALYLAEGAGKTQNGFEMVLPCPVGRLADMLHVGRASLYRALDSFTEQGIIERNNRYIRILDMDRLHDLANGGTT